MSNFVIDPFGICNGFLLIFVDWSTSRLRKWRDKEEEKQDKEKEEITNPWAIASYNLNGSTIEIKVIVVTMVDTHVSRLVLWVEGVLG